MIRTKPCAVCGTTETAMVFANDPWCSDHCHKAYLNGRGPSDARRTQK